MKTIKATELHEIEDACVVRCVRWVEGQSHDVGRLADFNAGVRAGVVAMVRELKLRGWLVEREGE